MYTYWCQTYTQTLWKCWLLGFDALQNSHKANVTAILAFMCICISFFLSELKDRSSCGCLFFHRRWCKYPWFPKSARLWNTTDPFWRLLERYSRDRARHKDAEIIGREMGGIVGWPPSWHSERVQLPGGGRRESFCSLSDENMKSFFVMPFSWRWKKKNIIPPPTHRFTHVTSSMAFYLSSSLLKAGADYPACASSTVTRTFWCSE